MHIDLEHLVIKSEGDVEAKLLVPFICSEQYLNIPAHNFYSKEYLAPTIIDKGAKSVSGYYPDFSIWFSGFPVMIIEAKAPGASVDNGYREACLYAQHLNKQYPSGFNPCQFVIASDGISMLFGYWDSAPTMNVPIGELGLGGSKFEKIYWQFGVDALRQHALNCLGKTKSSFGVRPFNRAGGNALINAKRPLNSFAATLSPILRRYFSSTTSNDDEIIRRAYVSSAETTEYDKVLEALLKDRSSVKRDTIVERLEPTRKHEPNVAKAIATFASERPPTGQLQIIQGAVGSGKSLFTRRYQRFLQSEDLRERCRWAWVDFNTAPDKLDNAEVWLCNAFLESFSSVNPELDLTSIDVLKGIFSRNIQRRKPIYDDIAKSSAEIAAKTRGDDLIKWQDDPLEQTKGIANYVLGGRQEVLIVVMDNVDRLDLKNQLAAFQLALWFMDQTKAFIILQMRDETYERFKNKPPLDTFRSGIAFHISPPRFTDVVKKRLELSMEYLSSQSSEVQNYVLPSGFKIIYPKSDLGQFLHDLYVELFERRRNISRILESLAGSDVRRALEMFVSIITSGHLGEDQITSQIKGAGGIRISEYNILKILMRTDYRFFSKQSGFITNIFSYENDWNKPSNFIIPEILFYLANNRKKLGQIGIEGYFSVKTIADVMQKIGIDANDCLNSINYILDESLVQADNMSKLSVGMDDSVKISASGYVHLRILAERIEYLYGIIPTIPISDETVVAKLAGVISRENSIGDISARVKVDAVQDLYNFFRYQAAILAQQSGNIFDEADANSGTAYILRQMKTGIDSFRNAQGNSTLEPNLLD